MADPLEKSLAPGEKLLYRAPRSWQPNGWAEELAIYAFALGLLALAGLLSFDRAGQTALAGALAPMLLHTLWVHVRDWSTEAVVTERRLLHLSGWLQPKLVEVNAASVAAVEACEDKLRITGRDGSVTILGHPHLCWGLGASLAHAASCPPPRLASRREILANALWIFVFLLAALGLAMVVLRAFYICCATDITSLSSLLFVAAVLIVSFICHGIGGLLGGPATLLLLRPAFCFEEMRDWITSSVVFWDSSAKSGGLDDYGARCLRLAAWLYGRSAQPPAGG